MSGDDDKGFLTRWSRRKAAARVPEAAASTEAPSETASAALQDDPVDAAHLASLPALDEITSATDLAPFLRAGVPAALRNAALRRMWSADPVIRDHLDVARDYAWDWNVPGGVPGGGGTLVPARVAEMAEKLRGAVVSGPPPEPAADVDPQTAEAVPDRPPPLLPAAEAPLAPQVEAPQPAAPNAEPAPSSPSGPRRRHGGAIPS